MPESNAEAIERRRLLRINQSLARMEFNAQQYLKDFELSSDYRMYRNAFLSYNFLEKLNTIVQFRNCDNADEERSYYLNGPKKIIICSNKVKSQDDFNQLMKLNLTYLYDQIRSDIKWSDCNQIACMKIRALNISGVCKSKDEQCFQDLLKKSFDQLEICRSKDQECFQKIFKPCVKDLSPINTIHSVKQGLFF